MNRRQRRADGRRHPGRADLQRITACPDCNSDVSIVEVAPHVHQAEVRHDDSCPWLASFERSGGLGVRFVRGEDQP